jgi:hypothetical protein
MKEDKDAFMNSLLKQRKAQFETKLKDFNRTIEEQRVIRLEERKKQRKEERRSKWVREKQEQEQKRRDEELKRQREEQVIMTSVLSIFLISTSDKVIYFEGANFQWSAKPLFTSQNGAEIS